MRASWSEQKNTLRKHLRVACAHLCPTNLDKLQDGVSQLGDVLRRPVRHLEAVWKVPVHLCGNLRTRVGRRFLSVQCPHAGRLHFLRQKVCREKSCHSQEPRVDCSLRIEQPPACEFVPGPPVLRRISPLRVAFLPGAGGGARTCRHCAAAHCQSVPKTAGVELGSPGWRPGPLGSPLSC